MKVNKLQRLGQTAAMALLLLNAGHGGAQEDVLIILGRPTHESIALSIRSGLEIEARVEYREKPGTNSVKTTEQIIHAAVPYVLELTSLKANTAYVYRLFVRKPGTESFLPGPGGQFHTQRAPGSAFTFAVQGDSHPERPGKMFDSELYLQTLQNVARQPPDFYLTMGDDFSIEHLISRGPLTQAAVDQVYAHQRSFLGVVGHSSALFPVNGNHEQAARYLLDGTDSNAAVMAARARMRFFPCPAPDTFYAGDIELVAHTGLLRDYYAWTWGDALFVVIDPYWHSPVPVDNKAGDDRRDHGEKKRDLWNVTLGDAQYRWLAATLTGSKARWKFVFCHHVLGTGRGGVECAPYHEWGGRSRSGEDEFAQKRPGWEMPIHQLMVKAGVTIFFQGHDHLFARQDLDGVVYQSCPNPADPTYQAFNRDAYRTGDVLPNSGFLRVTVSAQTVAVDYIRSWLPEGETSGHRNGETAFHYDIASTEKIP